MCNKLDSTSLLWNPLRQICQNLAKSNFCMYMSRYSRGMRKCVWVNGPFHFVTLHFSLSRSHYSSTLRDLLRIQVYSGGTIWGLSVAKGIFSVQSILHLLPTHFIILRVGHSLWAPRSGFIRLPTPSYACDVQGWHFLKLPISIYTRCLSLPGLQLHFYLQLVAGFEMSHPLISRMLLATGKVEKINKSQGVPFEHDLWVNNGVL